MVLEKHNVSILYPILQYLNEHYDGYIKFLELADINVEDITSITNTIGSEKLVKFLNIVTKITNNYLIGFEAGKYGDIKVFGILGQLMASCKNFEEYNQIRQSYPAILYPFEKITYKKENHIIDIILNKPDWRPNNPIIIDMMLVSHFEFLQNIFVSKISAACITLTREYDKKLEEVYQSYFKIKPKFSAAYDSITIKLLDSTDKIWTKAKIPAIHSILKILLEKEILFQENVIKYLLVNIGKNKWEKLTNIETVADHFKMSKRKFQYKLKSEGITYKELLAEVRIYISIMYLLFTDKSNSYISSVLGFSEQSSFTRFIKKNKNTSPTIIRKGRRNYG